MEYKRGDWVRFMRNGSLVIGEVAYSLVNSCGYEYLVTNIGEVTPSSIFECRPIDPKLKPRLGGRKGCDDSSSM